MAFAGFSDNVAFCLVPLSLMLVLMFAAVCFYQYVAAALSFLLALPLSLLIALFGPRSLARSSFLRRTAPLP